MQVGLQSESSKPAVIEIPMDPRCIAPTASFLKDYALSQDIPMDTVQSMCNAVQQVLQVIVDANRSNLFKEKTKIAIKKVRGEMFISIENHGYPFFVGEEWNKSAFDVEVQSGMQRIKELFSDISFDNKGRNGQRLLLITKIPDKSPSVTSLQEVAESNLGALNVGSDPNEEIEYREILPGEETALARLFFSVYGYNYINEYVYHPEKLRQMLQQKDLISRVAVRKNGELAAHVGVVRLNRSPAVYEIALGLTDPRIKVKGMFSKLFDQVFQIVNDTPMEYCIFDFVTNHDYSQKLVLRYGAKDLALGIGCQISRTQANLEKLGIGIDPHGSDRYSLLISTRFHKPLPFGKEIVLPVYLGEMFEFLLKDLGMTWSPAPRFYPVSRDGEFSKNLQPSQKAAYFDLEKPGIAALKAIAIEWRHLMRSDYCYAAVDVPLDAPGVGQVYDYLAKHGFFVAGFVPYHNSNQLGFRFQSIGPTRIDFNEIRLASATSKKLLEVVRNSYERNVII